MRTLKSENRNDFMELDLECTVNEIVEELLYLTPSSVLLNIWNFRVSTIPKESSLGMNEKSKV